MPHRTSLLLVAVLLAACASEEPAPEAAEADPETAPVAAVTEPSPDLAQPAPTPTTDDPADEEAPAGAQPVDIPSAGSMERPLSGVAVCEELEAALLAMRINPLDLEMYAAQEVIDELRANTVFRDPETGQNTPDEVASWVDEEVPGRHCSLSAGGDAWYRLQLVQLTDGRGDYATGFEMASSYDNGGP